MNQRMNHRTNCRIYSKDQVFQNRTKYLSTNVLPKPSINESLIERHKVYDPTKIATPHSEAKPRTQFPLILPRSLFLPQPTKRKSKERNQKAGNCN